MDAQLTPLPATPALGRAAPLDGWRRAVADMSVVSVSTVICHALGVVTSLLLRWLLDPAQMGIWQALKLLLSYSNYSNLGISKAATRDLSAAAGRGDVASAQRGLNLAFSVNTLASGCYALALVAVAGWFWTSSTSPLAADWAWGLASVAALALLQRHVSFHVSVLRARQEFGITSRLAVIEGLLTLLVGGTATWLWGLEGLCLATLVVLLGSWGYVHAAGATPFAWTWNTREIRRLIGVGGPILLAGTALSLFRSVDKLAILGGMNEPEIQLGCYSLALLLSGQIYGASNMLSMVMVPRYSALYGRTGDRAAVARLAAEATELTAAGMSLVAGLAIVVGAPLLGWILPHEYQPGLVAIVWLVPGTFALCVALPASQYLVAVDRQRTMLLIVVLGTCVAAAANWLAVRGGLGLRGVSAATAAAYWFYATLIVATSIWPQLDRAARRQLVTGVALVAGPALVVAVALHDADAVSHSPADVALKGFAVVVAWSTMAAIGYRRGEWSRLWSKEPPP